jgi:hypothetical protein
MHKTNKGMTKSTEKWRVEILKSYGNEIKIAKERRLSTFREALRISVQLMELLYPTWIVLKILTL